MIKIENVNYSIPNGDPVLVDVSFEIKSGDFIGVLGKNGAGKTTLIDLIMGFRRPTSGKVVVFDKDPSTSDRGMFNQISFLSQDVWLKDNISVNDFFKFHSTFYETYSIEDQNNLLTKFKVDLKLKIGGLSTGQKRRVQIIAAIASRPKILLIDEITAVLDPDARKVFFDLLIEINLKHNTAIVLATNIVEDLKDRIKNLIFIKDHKIEKHEPCNLDKLFHGDE